MLKEVLIKEAPSFFTLLSVRAKMYGLSIDQMRDDEIIEFARRDMGDHVAELLQRILNRYN